ncbi:hypothetical protein BDR22DRAFT_181607 [Usnea florida]
MKRAQVAMGKPRSYSMFAASFLFQSTGAAQILCIALLLVPTLHAADHVTFCNRNVYGSPISIDCIGGVSNFPINDYAIRWFVEQQLRTTPPQAVWNAFQDPRRPEERQTIVQLPRLVSSGQSDLRPLPSKDM